MCIIIFGANVMKKKIDYTNILLIIFSDVLVISRKV